jgi:hypothetical protein
MKALLLIYLIFVPLIMGAPSPWIETEQGQVTELNCEWQPRADVCEIADPLTDDNLTLHKNGEAIPYTLSGQYHYAPDELSMIRYKLSTYEPGQLFLVCHDYMSAYRTNGIIKPAMDKEN